METLEILQTARSLIADPERWITDYWSENDDGEWVDPTDPRACRWCLRGALFRAAGQKITDEERETDAEIFLVRALGLQGVEDLAYLNDDKGHAAVLAALDKGIEVARSSCPSSSAQSQEPQS